MGKHLPPTTSPRSTPRWAALGTRKDVRANIWGGGGLGEQLKFTEVSSHPVEQLEEAKGQRLEKVQFGGMKGEGEGVLGALYVAETKDARLQEGQVRGWRGDQALL